MNILENAKKSLQSFTKNSNASSEVTNCKDIPFHFGIDVLDRLITFIHEHTVSSNLQISSVTTLCLSYTCSYVNLKGCESYVFDLSPGATGKDSAFDRAYDLVLKPVMEMQNEKKAQYDYQRQSSDEKLAQKSFHCIHTADATEQGVIAGFDNTKAQFVAIGEVGSKLKNKEHPLINFITRVYGKNNIVKPNYKKDLGAGGDLTIDGISLFFYGNSNFQMLGKSTFKHHLVGGLLNRCILVYNTKTRLFEDRPDSYDISPEVLKESHFSIHRLMIYGEKNASKAKPKLIKTDLYVEFDRYIYDLTNQCSGSELEYLFKRVMQNLNAVIYTLHYLLGAQEDVWWDEVQESTIVLGINYMKYVLEGYDALIDEIIGASAEEREEGAVAKLHSVIFSLSKKQNCSKLKHRDIYRAAHLTRQEYDKLVLNMHYKTDKKFLHILTEPSMTSVTCDKTKEVS